MANYGFNEEEWANLYPLLRNRVARWVGRSRVPMWNSRRDLIVEDIVSEAILKMIMYAQRAECGEVRMIDSLESISSVTAYHCYVDALRRDRHLQPFMPEFEEPIGTSASRGEVDPSEVAIDNIDYELLFIHVARWIAILPDKQRAALLIDLANRMYIDPFEATPLQEALAREIGRASC